MVEKSFGENGKMPACNNMESLVSVIVPIYNVEKYVRHCIETIIHQMYKNLEIILVDDGSTDDSGRICDEFAKIDSRIKVIHQQNKGLGGARNSGLGIAKGDYICFIDSDDYISESFVYLLITSAKKQNSDLVVCGYASGRMKSFFRFSKEKSLKIECTISSRMALENWHGEHKNVETVAWNKLYKRKLFESGIRYPEKVYFEDVSTTPRLVDRAQTITFIKNKLYYYYQRKTSIQNGISDERIRHRLKMQEERLEWFKEKSFEQAYKRLLSKCLKYYMVCYMQACEMVLKIEIIYKFQNMYMPHKELFDYKDRIIFRAFNRWYMILDKIYQLYKKVAV